jgi:putative ABC transport system permease protein
MWKTTLRSLAAHKLRLALTAFAVVLGVAFMAGTFVLTDTLKHTFDALFAQTSAGKDAIVRAKTAFNSTEQQGVAGSRPRTPDTLVATVQAVPGVRAAEGAIGGLATVVGKDGTVPKKHAPTLALSWHTERELSSLTLREGRGPANGQEMTMDSGTAKSLHFAVGDQATVITNQPPRAFTIVGITGFGNADNLAGATLLTFDLRTAEELVGKPGYVNEIDVAATAGTPTDQLLTAIGATLPPGFEAVSGASVGQEQAKSVERNLSFFNTFLLTFALIALFVGAFLIFNTFSILVGQRTRELALLRAIGASRGQVNRSVLGEALVVGLTGSILGLLIGVPLAAGLYAALRAFGLDLPSTSLQLLPRTIVVCLLTGTVITILSAVLPARRAGRIPPVAAMREDASETQTPLRRRAISGLVVLAVGLALLFLGLIGGSGIGAVGAGAAVVFIGVAILAPLVASPLARGLGWPLPAVAGITGRLARENAARSPRRTAATASALMVGLGVVAAIATLGASLVASFNAVFDRTINADYVVVSSAQQAFSPTVEAAVVHVPDVVATSPVRQVPWHDGNVSRQVTGIDPIGGPQVFNIEMTSGSVDALGRGELLVDEQVAKDRHLQVGHVVHMGFDATGVVPVTVGGTYKTNQLFGNYTIGSQVVAANSNQVQDDALAIKTSSTGSDVQARLAAALHEYPNVSVKTAAQFKQDQKSQVNALLGVVYVLLALSILIALIGVVNTLVLSVLERTHEIGLLRAVGMHRRQIKRMVRGESVIVSLLGAVLGLAVGVGLGAAFVESL